MEEERFTPASRALALEAARAAISEQRDALKSVRDRALAVLAGVTAAGALLLEGVSPDVPGARGVAGWLALTAGATGLVVVLVATAQVLRPRKLFTNVRATTILGWGAEPEPDAELAMHLDDDRTKNAAVLESVHFWFGLCIYLSVPTVAAWAAVSIAWRS